MNKDEWNSYIVATIEDELGLLAMITDYDNTHEKEITLDIGDECINVFVNPTDGIGVIMKELTSEIERTRRMYEDRVKDLRLTLNEWRDYKNLPTLNDEQFYEVNDLLSNLTGYCVVSANLTNDTLTVKFDLEVV